MHDPPLDYNTFGKRFMDQYCAGCHSTQWPDDHGNRNEAPPTVNFDTYSGVVEWAERVYLRTYETGDMPPGGGPTDQDLVRFNEWMQCEVYVDAGVTP